MSTAVPIAWQDHLPRLRRLCGFLSGDPSAAEDLAQDVLLQAWQVRDRLRDADAAGPWLDAVARHVCARWRRERSRRPLTAAEEHLLTLPDLGPDLDEVLERSELRSLLADALALLPAPTREALVARYVEERGTGEIAAAQGSSPDAVTMRLARGRRRLQEVLADAVEERRPRPWRPTRLPCRSCGLGVLHQRSDGDLLEVRCRRCDPDDVTAAWQLANPAVRQALAGLDGLARPGAVLARLAAWGHDYWAPGVAAGRAACTGCGRRVAVEPYRRDLTLPWVTRHGWSVTCEPCGTSLSTSVAGLAQHHPMVQAVLHRDRRMHATEVRSDVVGRHDALAITFAVPSTSAPRGVPTPRVDVLVSADDGRLLTVRALTDASR